MKPATAMHVMIHCTRQQARVEVSSESVCRKDWDVTPTVSLQSIKGLIDIPWASVFQGERKTYFQDPESLIKYSTRWH